MRVLHSQHKCHSKRSRFQRRPQRAAEGISLIEIVVTLAVIAIISAISLAVIPHLLRQHKLSKVVATQAVLRNIAHQHLMSQAYHRTNASDNDTDLAVPSPYGLSQATTNRGLEITAQPSDSSMPTLTVLIAGRQATKECKPAGVSPDLASTCTSWNGRL